MKKEGLPLHSKIAEQLRMRTAVEVDGRGPYRFLVDTGAERSVIAEELALRLGLPAGAPVWVEGINRRVRSRLVSIARLTMGRQVCSELEVPTLPRATLGADGFLGLDVINGRRVIFDFRADTLTISKPLGFFASHWTKSGEELMRTLGQSGRLRASDCQVDGVAASAFIDTGAESSIINGALYATLPGHSHSQRLAQTIRLMGVAGGSVEAFVIILRRVGIGRLAFVGLPVAVADLKVFREWGLSDQPALLLGMNALRGLAEVSIDYARKELRLQMGDESNESAAG
jgi:predicted aspartyl protease